MDFGKFHFGSIAIDGVRYVHDVVIDCGKIRKRKRSPPRNSARSTGIPQSRTGIPQSRSTRRYRGNANASLSARADTDRCR